MDFSILRLPRGKNGKNPILEWPHEEPCMRDYSYSGSHITKRFLNGSG